ncbi:MAG: HAD family hydrolase [Alteromonadales bacterium]|nr:HAD family hydrolase [Alteromonadales bacterium]
MSKVYLFDWGDTLMVDINDQPGHMKDWPAIEEVKGAKLLLEKLSSRSQLFVATGSQGTNAELMLAAFSRTSFVDCLSGYFCPDNTGYDKPSADFYKQIASMVNCEMNDITMVGDNLERDILPALEVGMNAIWLNHNNEEAKQDVRQVNSLLELL